MSFIIQLYSKRIHIGDYYIGLFNVMDNLEDEGSVKKLCL